MEKIIILGPTASGKTKVAVKLAAHIDAKIISADSRQVYKGMDLGTGKDLIEYTLEDKVIVPHLINIVEAGERYNLARFQDDFYSIMQTLENQNVVVCGGSGLYIESIIEGFNYTEVPENLELRAILTQKTEEELDDLLNDQTINTRKRKIRALEILEFRKVHAILPRPHYNFKIFGLNPPITLRRELITHRLKERLQAGMIQEVEGLINKGVSHETLQYYGLEYKYISLFLKNELTYHQMATKLETEIHRYAKRQMTFFRSLEKKGIFIQWIPFELSLNEKVNFIKKAVS